MLQLNANVMRCHLIFLSLGKLVIIFGVVYFIRLMLIIGIDLSNNLGLIMFMRLLWVEELFKKSHIPSKV